MSSLEHNHSTHNTQAHIAHYEDQNLVWRQSSAPDYYQLAVIEDHPLH
jgi:hypothetical protein